MALLCPRLANEIPDMQHLSYNPCHSLAHVTPALSLSLSLSLSPSLCVDQDLQYGIAMSPAGNDTKKGKGSILLYQCFKTCYIHPCVQPETSLYPKSTSPSCLEPWTKIEE